MKTSLIFFFTASLCLAGDHHDRWPVRDQETMQKTLSLSGAAMRLTVDNVEGYVHIKGVTGSEVRINAHKTIYAETDSDLATARAEVKLNITEQAGSASVRYDAPWRCTNGGPACHSAQRRSYSVAYDIDIEVPAAAGLMISTVNGGDIRIDNTNGDFDVSHVNGGIQMSGVAGSGLVHTVNGSVSVHFERTPASATSFKSVNGSLDVWLPATASADLLFKTFNGGVYSDFEVAPRPIPAAASSEQRDGKFVYRSNGSGAGRLGNGGPELKFETLNGTIRIHREE